MAKSARSLGTRVLFWGAVALGVAVCARTGWRLQESVALARLSQPLQRPLVRPALRLLIVGDSTAVGTGASAPQASVAGLLAERFPRLQIDLKRTGCQSYKPLPTRYLPLWATGYARQLGDAIVIRIRF